VRGSARRELYQFTNITDPRHARYPAPWQPALGFSSPGLPLAASPSPLPNPSEATLEPGPHGEILARWPYALDSGRRVTLHARLIERGTELVVCEWDLADL